MRAGERRSDVGGGEQHSSGYRVDAALRRGVDDLRALSTQRRFGGLREDPLQLRRARVQRAVDARVQPRREREVENQRDRPEQDDHHRGERERQARTHRQPADPHGDDVPQLDESPADLPRGAHRPARSR